MYEIIKDNDDIEQVENMYTLHGYASDPYDESEKYDSGDDEDAN